MPTTRSKMRRSRFALLAILLLLARTLTPVPAAGAGGTDSSAGTVSRVGERYAFIRDPEILDTIGRIGNVVSHAYRVSPERYHFYVLQSPDVNAFVTPSGDIFLFSGQLMKLRCQDELAAVLAHEMAHKEADHFGEISRKSALVALPTIVALILSKGDEAVVASSIAVAGAYQLHFSREMEEEADLMAFNSLRKTSFDPLGMAGALSVIEQAGYLMPSSVPDHLSTHPPVEIRKASLESILGTPLSKVEWSPSPTPDWLRFKAILAGVAGDSSQLLKRRLEQSWREASAFEHHLMGLALSKARSYPEALEEFEAALAASPDDPLLLADAGAARFLAGESAAARPLLERAAKALPDFSYPVYYLAEMARLNGRTREALQLYQKAVTRQPVLPEAYHGYGTILQEEGQNGEAAFHLGVSALLQGKFREALSLLEEAKRQLGGNPFWRDRIESRLATLR